MVSYLIIKWFPLDPTSKGKWARMRAYFHRPMAYHNQSSFWFPDQICGCIYLLSCLQIDKMKRAYLLQMDFFSIYTIYEYLSRRKNSLPTFVSKVPIVPVMDSLLSMLAHSPTTSKLITGHTRMCTLRRCVHRVGMWRNHLTVSDRKILYLKHTID